jgi:phosphoglycolate phosphatase-like HAD superfamily hydrolase
VRVKGVVFDLDATLINLGGFVDWRKAHTMAQDAYLTNGCPHDMINRLGEKGLFNMLNIEVCEWEGTAQCYLLPDCLSTLGWLAERGVRMGVATSNSQDVAEWILESKKIHRFFSSVVGRRLELKMKPNPDQILKCFEEMSVEPSRGVVVGDSVKDIQAAKSAGVAAIAVPSFFTRRQALVAAGADYIIENLGALPKTLSFLDKI